MTTMTFHSDDPSLHGLDIDHGELGMRIERAMTHEAYLDRNHPLHARAVSDVRHGLAVIHGEAPTDSGFKGLTMAFSTGLDGTAQANPIATNEGQQAAAQAAVAAAGFAGPAVWSSNGTPDEHSYE